MSYAANFKISTLIVLLSATLSFQNSASAQVTQRPDAKPVIERLTTQPSDFPVSPYTNNLIGQTRFQRNGSVQAQSISALSQTKDDPATAYQWFQAELKGGGWSVETPNAKNTPQAQLEGKLFMLKASHGHTVVMVCCSRVATPYTTITVTASQQ